MQGHWSQKSTIPESKFKKLSGGCSTTGWGELLYYSPLNGRTTPLSRDNGPSRKEAAEGSRFETPGVGTHVLGRLFESLFIQGTLVPGAESSPRFAAGNTVINYRISCDLFIFSSRATRAPSLTTTGSTDIVIVGIRITIGARTPIFFLLFIPIILFEFSS